jgi:hypothetical protein
MSNTISNLPSATQAHLTDIMPATQGSSGPGSGTTKGVTLQQQFAALAQMPIAEDGAQDGDNVLIVQQGAVRQASVSALGQAGAPPSAPLLGGNNGTFVPVSFGTTAGTAADGGVMTAGDAANAAAAASALSTAQAAQSSGSAAASAAAAAQTTANQAQTAASAALEAANQALSGVGAPSTLVTTSTNVALDATHASRVVLMTELAVVTLAGGSDALASGKAFSCQVIASGGPAYLGPNITNSAGDGLIHAGGKAEITVYRNGNIIAGIAQGDTGPGPAIQLMTSDFSVLDSSSYWTMLSDLSAAIMTVPGDFTMRSDFAEAALAAAQLAFTMVSDLATMTFSSGSYDATVYAPFDFDPITVSGRFAVGGLPTPVGAFLAGDFDAITLNDAVTSDFAAQDFALSSHDAAGLFDTILINTASIGSMIIGEATIG